MSDSSSSTSSGATIGITFVFNFVLFTVFVIAFLILRPRYKNVYQPRVVASTVIEDEKPRSLSENWIVWVKDLVTRSDAEILQIAGLDGYFFLRYLRLMLFICLVGIIVLFPILLPINGTGGGGQTGFDILAFVNISAANKDRYYAHVIMGWVFFGFILFTLYRELQFYVAIRQAVLTSGAYSNLVSSRTVLINTIPQDYLSAETLGSIFEGVKFVFINRKYKELEKKVNKRQKMATKIESAEVSYLKKAVKNRLNTNKGKPEPEGDEIDLYVPNKKRPTHRLKPIIGEKVDTINYCSEKLQELNEEIKQLQDAAEEAPRLNSAFITFHTQEQAEIAFQVLTHHRALHMAPRFIGIRPDEIVWGNLRLLWWERLVRSLGAASFLTALIIFWAIPVSFVGFLSNISSLESALPFLDFLNNLPSWLFGLVTGILPTVLLALLMMLLPPVIRLMARIAGQPSTTLVEYYTQGAYFGFQVVQVFLVTTISSGASAVISDIINDPSSAMYLLATSLPKASNFYIAYFMLQGFTACGGMLLQIVALVLFYVLGFVLDNSPRKRWNRYNVIGPLGWGTVFPIYTNLAVITISYSIISPLLLGFSAVTFGLIYFAYLHNLMFVNRSSDGRGIYYCRAIFQTFTGLYLAQICLLGLFVLAKTWGPVALQAIFLGFTVFVHYHLNKAFEPLLHRLPTTLLHDSDRRSLAATVPVSSLDKQRHHSPSPMETTETGHTEAAAADVADESARKASPRGGAFVRYFMPHRYLTPSVLHREVLSAPVFNEPAPFLSNEEESVAYRDPCVVAPNPVVWLPRDPWGLSAKQIGILQERDVNSSHAGTWFDIDDANKKSSFDFAPSAKDIPVWEEPIKY
jgi:hypothetical protein